MKKSDLTLVAKTSTWHRDSHGLFDYEFKSLTKNTIKTNEPGIFYRQEHDILFQTSDNAANLPPESKAVLALGIQEGEAYIGFFSINVANYDKQRKWRREEFDKLWLVVRYLKGNGKGYLLSEGDVVRMGRLKYRVQELMGNATNETPINLNDYLLGDQDQNAEQPSDDEDQPPAGIKFSLPCRICLSEYYEEDNPLVSLCKCDGTMKYIHVNCLKQWMKSRLVTRASENCVSLCWKTLDCELCQRPFPYSIIYKGKIIELLKIPKPPGRYMILEALKKDKEASKGLHIISFCNKKQIRVGRGHDPEFRVSDISVSRCHGIFKVSGSNFYLEDNSSKFGTLVQIKRPLALDANKELCVQGGRTVFMLLVKKPWSLVPACFRSSNNSLEVFSTTTNGDGAILPYNTGIPISINDNAELLQRAGFPSQRKIERNEQQSRNLMYNHTKFGKNSSIEEDSDDEIMEVEAFKVEIGQHEEFKDSDEDS